MGCQLMQAEEPYRRLVEVFQEVLDMDDLVLTRETTANQVDGWDSLAHVRIVIGIEQAFGIRFETAEVAGLGNVGDLFTLIESKLG